MNRNGYKWILLSYMKYMHIDHYPLGFFKVLNLVKRY